MMSPHATLAASGKAQNPIRFGFRPKSEPEQLRFLFVHGSWHGAWCWQAVLQALKGAGHHAAAIDLPGSRADGGWQTSRQQYAAAINSKARSMGGEVHLVGHSLGGMSITAAAETEPLLYSSLSFLTALLLPNRARPLNLGVTMRTLRASIMNPLRGHITMRSSAAQEMLYGDCDEEQANAAIAALTPQPIRPTVEAINHSPTRFGSIPRHYVFCERDQALPIDLQKRMSDELTCQQTLTLNSDHSPFLSHTEELVHGLVKMCEKSATSKRSVRVVAH